MNQFTIKTEYDPELAIDIAQIKQDLAQVLTNFQPKEPPRYVTREDVKNELKVSYVTLNDWDKKGILKKCRLGTRVYYRRDELEKILENSKRKN